MADVPADGYPAGTGLDGTIDALQQVSRIIGLAATQDDDRDIDLVDNAPEAVRVTGVGGLDEIHTQFGADAASVPDVLRGPQLRRVFETTGHMGPISHAPEFARVVRAFLFGDDA